MRECSPHKLVLGTRERENEAGKKKNKTINRFYSIGPCWMQMIDLIHGTILYKGCGKGHETRKKVGIYLPVSLYHCKSLTLWGLNSSMSRNRDQAGFRGISCHSGKRRAFWKSFIMSTPLHFHLDFICHSWRATHSNCGWYKTDSTSRIWSIWYNHCNRKEGRKGLMVNNGIQDLRTNLTVLDNEEQLKTFCSLSRTTESHLGSRVGMKLV